MSGRTLPVAAIRELTEIVPIALSSRQVARIAVWAAKLVDDALAEAAAAAKVAPSAQTAVPGAGKNSALVADQTAARGGVTGPAPADHGNGKAHEVAADLTRKPGKRADQTKPAEPAVPAGAVVRPAVSAVPAQTQPAPGPAAAPVPAAPVAIVTPRKESELARIAQRIAILIDGAPRPLVAQLMDYLALLPPDPSLTPAGDLTILIDLAAGQRPQSIAAVLGVSAPVVIKRFRAMVPSIILDRFGALTLDGRLALLEAAKRNAVAS